MQKDVSAVQKGHRLSFCLPHRNTQTQQSKNGKKKLLQELGPHL